MRNSRMIRNGVFLSKKEDAVMIYFNKILFHHLPGGTSLPYLGSQVS
jgi:hypothetical protein